MLDADRLGDGARESTLASIMLVASCQVRAFEFTEPEMLTLLSMATGAGELCCRS